MTAIEHAPFSLCPSWCTGEHDIERADLTFHEGPTTTVHGGRYGDLELYLQLVTFTDAAPHDVLVILDGIELPLSMATELAGVLRDLAGIGRRST